MTSNNIYPSSKPAPYVYLCTHRETGEFYIGYRRANVALNRTSNYDLPRYQTSAPLIKTNFANFDWQIIAEFLDGDSAQQFENQLIKENWGNPLLLNRFCHWKKDKKLFRGPTSHSASTKAKISKAILERGPISDISRAKISASLKKANKENPPKPITEETRLKMSKAHLGRKYPPISEETRAKIVEAAKNRPAVSTETRAKISLASKNRKPASEETRAKIAATKIGRKLNKDLRTFSPRINIDEVILVS